MREAAVLALGFFSQTDQGPLLKAVLERLTDEKLAVRRSAIITLGRTGQGSVGVYEALKALEDDEDELVRTNVSLALTYLGKSGSSSISKIMPALKNNENSTALMAEETISKKINEFPEIVKPYLFEMMKDQSSSVISRSINVLRNLKEPDDAVIDSMIDAFPRVDLPTRTKIVKSVADMDHAGSKAIGICLESLASPDPVLVKEGLLCSMKYRPLMQPYLARILPLLDSKDEEIKILAISIIRGTCKLGANCITKLIQLINDTSQKVKLIAISTLGALGDSSDEAVEALSRVLRQRDEKVRLGCVSALKTMGSRNPERVINVLKQALDDETDLKVKKTIIATIKHLEFKPSR